ncbi:MAG: 3-oxoacyl-[acyl-carrier-protein] reductase [Deltaproteobacteria bacterium]|nr:3-oxoacyl-[acyl-carrier-protein] reductase [Deltaproteobacteria bacterium]
MIITGGARGIGRALCLAFAGPDTEIFFNYSSSGPEAEETGRLVDAAGGHSTGVCADVADEDAMSAFFKRINDETGRIDVLVNNAGITRDSLVMRMKASDWDAVMDVNLKGAFICTKLASRAMIRRRWGRIINITSVAGVAGNPGQANYSAAKAGLIGLTKSVARELASRNITVNAIAPGYIDTGMTARIDAGKKADILANIPLGRPGAPDDVAGLAFFLASDCAAYITGQVVHVNGGMYI